MSMTDKRIKLKLFLTLTIFTVLVFLNFNSSYLDKLPFGLLYQNEAHLNAYEFPKSCWTATFDPFNEIALGYMNGSLKQLKKRYGECDKMSSKGTVTIEDLSKNSDNEEYLVKINPEYFLKREKLSQTASNDLECSIMLIEKKLNKPDRLKNLKYKKLASDKVNLGSVRPFEFKLYISGFFHIQCLHSFENKLNTTPVYGEVIWIYPANMKKLVERNANHQATREERLREIKKFDSEENPMTYDVPYEECDKVGSEHLEDKMNVLIIALDAVSFPNLRRVFPLTYKYLSQELENNIIYENLNIHGDNTYAANLAFHGGIIKEPNPEVGVLNEVEHYNGYLNQSDVHDLYPFVLRSFEKLGYFTSMNQDRSVFHYMREGFL
jgi:hypothetical protein